MSKVEQGGQQFVKVETLPYVRADGLAIHLDVWQSECAECGAPFRFTSPSTAIEFKPNRRCARHRKPGRVVKAPAHAWGIIYLTPDSISGSYLLVRAELTAIAGS